ncbi:MAG: hypothetical protein K6T17_07830, partial [Fimbriimonadales bacterium]|nr:hypothetical protein [Fimbriimonadales bacterium]
SAHWHLIVNHLPVLGFMFSVMLLLLGFLMRSVDVKRAALLGMVLSALFGVVAFLTGEPAEEIVEGLPTVSREFLEQHESMGKIAMYGGVGAGLVALIALFFQRRRVEVLRVWGVIGLVVGIAASGLFGYTAFLGGKVNHPELRGGVTGGTGGKEHEEREEH